MTYAIAVDSVTSFHQMARNTEVSPKLSPWRYGGLRALGGRTVIGRNNTVTQSDVQSILTTSPLPQILASIISTQPIRQDVSSKVEQWWMLWYLSNPIMLILMTNDLSDGSWARLALLQRGFMGGIPILLWLPPMKFDVIRVQVLLFCLAVEILTFLSGFQSPF